MSIGETGVPSENLAPNTVFVHHKFQFDSSGFEPGLPEWKADTLAQGFLTYFGRPKIN